MATLTTDELTTARQLCAAAEAPSWTKPQINAALQAIEDAMTTQNIPQAAVGATMPQYISGRIDNATSPFQFVNGQKKRLFALWAKLKFEKDT